MNLTMGAELFFSLKDDQSSIIGGIIAPIYLKNKDKFPLFRSLKFYFSSGFPRGLGHPNSFPLLILISISGEN